MLFFVQNQAARCQILLIILKGLLTNNYIALALTESIKLGRMSLNQDKGPSANNVCYALHIFPLSDKNLSSHFHPLFLSSWIEC